MFGLLRNVKVKHDGTSLVKFLLSNFLLFSISGILEVILFLFLLGRHPFPVSDSSHFKKLFNKGVCPKLEDLVGIWEGRFFGRFRFSPKLIRMHFKFVNAAVVDMHWSLMKVINGESLVQISE